jgi:integrase
MKRAKECWVRTVTTKGKITAEDKLIGRRSEEEAGFLDEVVEFVTRSGAAGDEEMFCSTRPDGSRMSLRSRTVREELKRTCEGEGLPPTTFSSHSLRKGAITHMRALGASEDDRRDRGNYAPMQYVRKRGRPRTVFSERAVWSIPAARGVKK